MDNNLDISESQQNHVLAKTLSADEIEKINAQNSRLVSEYQARQLEINAKKHWDIFYKRNESRFFKDRHWTTREFQELLNTNNSESLRIFFEIGCGVGNLIYPLLEDGIEFRKIFACDLSPRAIQILKDHSLFDNEKINAFQTDITCEMCFSVVNQPVDLATLVFVLSSIHPEHFKKVIKNIAEIMAKDGVVLFRDYGRYDMAQLRFKPGHKIAENFYMRQDGTRSYYFTTKEVQDLFHMNSFKVIDCSYIQRRTVNLKKNIDVPRIFVQGKFMKI